MKVRFLNSALHGVFDYVGAALLIVLPIVLGLGKEDPLEFWLSVYAGVALIGYSMLTSYRLGLVKLVPFDLHLISDLLAAAAFFGAPTLFDFTRTGTIYYGVMAMAISVAVALTKRDTGFARRKKRAAARAPMTYAAA